MEWITREYEIESHNELCAIGKALANILEELLGEEYVSPTGFISQRIKLKGANSENSDIVGIAIQGGVIINYEMWNGNLFDKNICTERFVAHSRFKITKQGYFDEPYGIEISIKWESKEAFLKMVEDSALKHIKGEIAKSQHIAEGSSLFFEDSDKTIHKIKVTAVGQDNFLAIGDDCEEKMYSKYKPFKWGENR